MTREEEIKEAAYESRAQTEYCFLQEEEGQAYIKGFFADGLMPNADSCRSFSPK